MTVPFIPTILHTLLWKKTSGMKNPLSNPLAWDEGMYKILLIDEYAYFYELLKKAFYTLPIDVLRLKNTVNYNDKINDLNPDILILDMSLQDYDAGMIISDIKENHPGLPIILTSVFEMVREEPFIEMADAFVLKQPDTIPLTKKIFEFLPELESSLFSLEDNRSCSG